MREDQCETEWFCVHRWVLVCKKEMERRLKEKGGMKEKCKWRVKERWKWYWEIVGKGDRKEERHFSAWLAGSTKRDWLLSSSLKARRGKEKRKDSAISNRHDYGLIQDNSCRNYDCQSLSCPSGFYCEAWGRRITAQHSTAQHSTAQHSTAQHSKAQHSKAQHSRHVTQTQLPQQDVTVTTRWSCLLTHKFWDTEYLQFS